MPSILLIAQNPKEIVLFRQIFLKLNIKLITSSPSYSSYLKALQYEPDALLMEIPSEPKSHLNFLKIIRGNKQIGQIPVVLYGPPFDAAVSDKITGSGASNYFARPLDMKKMITALISLMKKKNEQEKKVTDRNQLLPSESEILLDKKSAVSVKLDIMYKHIGQLLAFPATVASVLRVAQSDRSGAHQLAEVISGDPAISAKILNVANSVHFARGGKRVLDIKNAVVRLGFDQTKNIATSLSVFKTMQTRNFETGFNHTEFWFHSIGVALIAGQLAKQNHLISPDQAFLAGLLHDLGILLYNEYFNTLFLQLIEATTTEGIRFVDCQMELLGFNHNELMGRLFSEWNFPEEFVREVPFFGNSSILNTDALAEHPIAVMVNCAEIIAKSLLVGREADCCVDPIPAALLIKLCMPYGLSRAFIDTIYNEINVFNQILHVDQRTYPLPNKQIKEIDTIEVLCHSFTGEPFNPVITYLQQSGYKVTIVNDLDEFYESKRWYHLYVMTDAVNAAMGSIEKLSQVKAAVYPSQTDQAPIDPARIVMFDGKKEVDFKKHVPQSVVSHYPVDLRNIDMVLACLLQDFPLASPLNTRGAFRPVKKITGSSAIEKKQMILLAHGKSSVREALRRLFDDTDYIIEETSDGPRAFNLARTSSVEIALVIIDLHIALLDCAEVVKQIKMLPSHKRARYIVMYEHADRKNLMSLISLDVKEFCSEQTSVSELRKKIEAMGVMES